MLSDRMVKMRTIANLNVLSVKTVLVGVTVVLMVAGPKKSESQQMGGGPRRVNPDEKIPTDELENWAVSFGSVLWETARVATRFDAVQEKFHQDGAKVERVDGYTMVREMANDVMAMMQHKIDAVKRIMDFAENLALGHEYDKDLGHRLKENPSQGGFHYFNAKKINVIDPNDDADVPDFRKYLSAHDRPEDDPRFRVGYSRVELEENSHFSGIPVNTNLSAVHVPTNVFDGDPKVVNAIKWSRGLDRVFTDNYNRDPSLSWQYFGSSTGFMRQYPAMKWITSDTEPDLYDSRMREWYIKAAASPKEIVILLDTSGSMTGLRKEVAKHVVLNILDTLSEDDFVAAYRFSEIPEPLVECFSTPDGRAELVQATTENLRQFREAVEQVETQEIANFTSALDRAFDLLYESRLDPSVGANCNQAIMLITDGVPYKYEELFKKHNLPHKPVRVFTYLIGREISDLKAANWIACQNRGYFSHVTTMAEVKEQVLQYIPVMARPMVMYRSNHPIKWTGVYADVEVLDDRSLWIIKLKEPARRSEIFKDPKTSRWLWDMKERRRQKRRTQHYRDINNLQQKHADSIATMDTEEDSAAAKEAFEKFTKLSDETQLRNYLAYGKWDLSERDVERLENDKKIKDRIKEEITEAKTLKWTIPPKEMSYEIERRFIDEMREHDIDPFAEKEKNDNRNAESIDYDGEPRVSAIKASSSITEKRLHNLRQLEENSKLRKGKFTGYRLMTTVSIPVFDKKNHTNVTERTLVSLTESIWAERSVKNYTESIRVSDKKKIEETRKVRIAELLGVAGTDVPIGEIEKLTPPFKLGVNGYSFAVNNNGYVLFHPDLRPMFQEILKPNYNSVDLAEVELPMKFDEYPEPRANDTELLSMRQDMVNQKRGQTYLTVKQHYDDMKRATIRTLDYFYHPLVNTPFTLGIAIPQDYGKYRVDGKVDVALARFNVSSLFEDRDWRLHPDWVYCQYNYGGDQAKEFETPEDEMKHFLVRMQKPGWNWGTAKVRPLPSCGDSNTFDPNCQKAQGMDKMDLKSHVCNRELVESMVFDAMVTHNFEKMKSPGRGEVPDEIYKKVGIRMGFIATRSGLLRFSDHNHLFEEPEEKKKKKKRRRNKYVKIRNQEEDEEEDENGLHEPHFSDVNNKATDEIWYRRAVDYHKVNPDAFLFSVPFDIGERKTMVMATKAIMVGRGSQQTPAGVAGMQIDYEVFREMFFNETKTCVGNQKCERTCASDDLECYVVDNNGFVVISEDRFHTGKFFGEVDGTILESLVKHNIFRQIRIYDYQAICLEPDEEGSPGNIMITPLQWMAKIFNFIVAQLAWVIINFEIRSLWNPDWTYAYTYNNDEPPRVVDYGQMDTAYYDSESNYPYLDENGMDLDPFLEEFAIKNGGRIPLLQMTYINKTIPRPCDKHVDLYELNDEKLYKPNKISGKPTPVKGKLSNCHESECERPFSVTLIPHTNMIMIVADKLCPCFSTKISIEPVKVEYGPSNSSEYCERQKYNIYRRKPLDCFSYHAEESEIKLCGSGSQFKLAKLILFTALSLLFAISRSANTFQQS